MAATNSFTMETNSFVEKFDFTWKIHNFSKHLDLLESSFFTPLANKKTQFSVSIGFEYTMHSTGKDHLSCVIDLKKTKEIEDDGKKPEKILNNTRVVVDLKITNAEGSDLKVIPKSNPRLLRSFGKLTIGIMYQEIERNAYWSPWDIFNISIIPNDDTVVVTIHFEFFGHKVTTKSCALFLTNTPQKHLSILSTDFKNIYTSKSLTDISIRIGDSVVQAHQTVLAARSPVFKRMLESDCLESETKTLTVNDVDFYVFDCFMKYLYSGVVEDKAFSTVYRLYSVADKYEVFSLQKECAEVIASSLNAENVCSVLKLSYTHSDEPLKEKAAFFVSSCFSEVKSLPEWIEMFEKYPKLGSEVLDSIMAGLKI